MHIIFISSVENKHFDLAQVNTNKKIRIRRADFRAKYVRTTTLPL